MLEAVGQVRRARDGFSKKVRLPVELKGMLELLNIGVDVLRRQSVTEWLEERCFTRAETSKYDADTQ